MTKNNIITMTNAKFGTVRKIVEGDSVLYCARDVAIALGYATPQKAVYDHCKGVLKRNTPTKSGNQQMSFIPEADVYRLICHSKLPSAMEFEKWVFEDVVPKAVDKNLNPEPEQLTLETSEYHYFPKTLNGEPVITLADFEHLTGINVGSARVALRRHCLQNIDFFLLTKSELRAFKLENHFSGKLMNSLIAITKSGVEKLLRFYECSAEIPMIEEKPVIKPKVKRTAGEILDERKITHDDCIIALDVLRRIERNCEYNVKMAEDEGRNTKFYRQELSEVKNIIKGIGMLMVMGY